MVELKLLKTPPMPKIADGVEAAGTRRAGTGTAMAAGVGRGDDRGVGGESEVRPAVEM